MKKENLQIITNFDASQCSTIGIVEMIGVDRENYTCESTEFKYFDTDSVLNRIRDDNKYGIKIKEVRLCNDRKARAKVYCIPYRKVMSAVSELELQDIFVGGYIMFYNKSNNLIEAVGTKIYTEWIRVYCIEHYSRDGLEKWYYDRKGNRCSLHSGCNIYFATYEQAKQFLEHKIHDGCANIVKFYKDLRFVATS